MKKKIVTIALITAMVVSTLTGCSLTKESSSTGPVSTSVENNGSEAANVEEIETTPDATESAENEMSSTETTSTEIPAEDGSTTETEHNAQIAEDLFSWQVTIDGIVYTLPCDVSEFEKNGWKLEGEGTLEKNRYTFIDIEKGEDAITVFLQNKTDKVLDYAKCPVVGVDVTLWKLKSDISVVFPGNLVVSKKLTKEEIIEKYGQPTEESDSDATYSMTYKYQNEAYKKWDILFSKDDGEVNSIEYKNFY